MTLLKHYDLGTGHVSVISAEISHDLAEIVMDYLVSQDHGTDDVYYLDDVEC